MVPKALGWEERGGTDREKRRDISFKNGTVHLLEN
jgi:hypothetical protein